LGKPQNPTWEAEEKGDKGKVVPYIKMDGSVWTGMAEVWSPILVLGRWKGVRE
jgi:hypothetical protein